MSLKITKTQLILLLIYLETVILGFFGQTQNCNKIILILICISLISDINYCKKDFPLIIIFCALYAVSMFMGTPGISNGIRNFLVLLYPFSQAYYILYLSRYRSELLQQSLRSCFWIFNITAVVNLMVALIQGVKPGLITPVNTYGYEVMSFDNITGLFSYGATHTLCMFTVFVIIYDISVFGSMRNSMKIFLAGFIMILTMMMLLVSIVGDNKAFFMVLPIALALYFVLHYLKEANVKIIFQILILGLCFLLLLLVLYMISSSFRNLADKYFIETLNLIKNAVNIGTEANGSGERIAILGFALKMPSTWLAGTGFGSAMIFEAGYMGFNHFGQADLGAILLLGGIWLTILVLVGYCRLFMDIALPKEKHNAVCWFAMVVFVLLISIYTQCFTRTDIMLCLLLTMASINNGSLEHD